MKRSKKFTRKWYLLSPLLLIFFGALVIETDQSNDDKVAALLERSDAIKMGIEWRQVQNEYSKHLKNLKTNPKSSKSKLRLSRIFIREARVTGEHGHYYPAALKLLNEVVQAKPNQDVLFQALTLKAGVQLSLHEFRPALKTAQQAVAINPLNAQIHGVLVDCYVELGNYPEAVKEADKMISIRPDLRAYARISYLREIHGEIEPAIQSMELAVSAGYPEDEETSWAMLTLGDLLFEYGETERAKVWYEKILTQRPNYPFAIAAIGKIAKEKAKWNQAEKLLKQAIEIIPEVGFYVELADLYKQQDRTVTYKQTCDEIFEMLKDDEDSGHNMNMEYASIYTHLIPDYEKALDYLEKELKVRPNNNQVNRMLGEVYTLMNNTETAKKYILKAQQTGSQHPALQALQVKLF